MGTIKRTEPAIDYRLVNRQSAALGEKNDCAVIAVALVSGADYNTVHAEFASRGRKRGKGVMTGDVLGVVRDLGHTFSRVNLQAIIDGYPGRHATLSNVTTHHPARFHAQWPKGKFLMFVRRHVLAVIDGRVHDWSEGRALRAYSIYEIGE